MNFVFVSCSSVVSKLFLYTKESGFRLKKGAFLEINSSNFGGLEKLLL
jgi:hypothetical protein